MKKLINYWFFLSLKISENTKLPHCNDNIYIVEKKECVSMKKVINIRVLVQVVFFIFAIFSIRFLELSISRLVVLGITFLIGSYHCGWICPFGTLQEYIGKIRKKFIKNTYNISEKFDKAFSLIRYIPLFIAVAFITDTMNARKIMFTLLRGKQILVISLVIFIIFLILSLFVERPFCRWFCVDGGRYGLLSFGRIITIKRNNDKCTDCQKCDKSCPMNIKISKCRDVINPKCINCLSCIYSCSKEKALKVGLRSFSSKYSLITYLIAVVFGAWILMKLLKI